MVDVDSACLIAAHCGEVQPASSTSPYLCSPEHHFTFIYVRLGKFNQFQFNFICVFWSNAINVIINFIPFQHQLYPCHHHCVRTRPESRWWSSRLDVPLVPHWTARRTFEGWIWRMIKWRMVKRWIWRFSKAPLKICLTGCICRRRRKPDLSKWKEGQFVSSRWVMISSAMYHCYRSIMISYILYNICRCRWAESITEKVIFIISF